LGDPHRGFESVLVVGTNGKGSVCAMLAAMLRKAGRRVGLYTSPHLVSITERIQVNGRPISEADFAHGVGELASALGSAAADLDGYRTTFELLTALAFTHFSRAGVDIAVIEAGLGARLDATAVIDPVLSIITPIHLDHTATLGRTLAVITRDKAAAIRRGVPLVTAPQLSPVHAVLREEAEAARPASWTRVGVDIRYRGRPGADGFHAVSLRDRGWRCTVDRAPLRGAHQAANAATAVAAFRRLTPEASQELVREGLAATRWPGRLDVQPGRPTILLDGAHNPHGARTLARFLDRWDYLQGRPRVVLLAISTGKDARRLLEILRPHADTLIACQAVEQRGLPAEEVGRMASAAGFSAVAVKRPDEALACARRAAGSDGVVIACGSLYLVGAVAEALGLHQDWWH
jgi:dihydrofolate synthase/folylpolyglutamate synthase